MNNAYGKFSIKAIFKGIGKTWYIPSQAFEVRKVAVLALCYIEILTLSILSIAA
jgi:hypothetical protein